MSQSETSPLYIEIYSNFSYAFFPQHIYVQYGEFYSKSNQLYSEDRKHEFGKYRVDNCFYHVQTSRNSTRISISIHGSLKCEDLLKLTISKFRPIYNTFSPANDRQ